MAHKHTKTTDNMFGDSRTRRSRSVSPDHDEDADYQLALRLSAELNSSHELPLESAAPTRKSDNDDDADFALALELQFGGLDGTYAGKETATISNSGSSWGGPVPSSEASPWASGRNKAKTAAYHPETPGGQTFKTLTDFIHHVRSAQCSKCGWEFFRSDMDVTTMLRQWKEEKAPLTSWLKCINCSTSSCITCTPEPFVRQSFITVQGKKISWCCAGGRLLLLWLLACGFDEHFSATKLKEVTKPKEEVQHDRKGKRKTKQPARGGGVGFGGPHNHSMPPMPAISSMPGGLGYGSDMLDTDEMADDIPWTYSFPGAGYTLSGHPFAPNATNTDGKVKALNAQQADDNFNGLFLELLEGLLPSFDRESTYDFDPPEAVADIISESKMLSYCAELLRNDSLEDATKRKDLYHALISFLRTLGAHYATASRAVYNERPLRDDKTNLLVLSFCDNPEVAKEKGSSLFESLHNFNTQSALVFQGAKSNEKDFRTEEGQNLLLFCRQISDLYQYLLTNSSLSGDATPVTSDNRIPALADLPDDQVLATHHYASAAKSLRSAPPGRFKRLITELTTLKTGLPPGIFVRYAESRPDVQKVVIIGPVGTPYENGIFEFDFFCSADFPNKPPLVQFKTTGGGRVSFNPNLYPDGKVCLSLLGTWQGEPWVPGESTLLQVLISLQAMVLCEEPWYNEPGREAAYNPSPEQGPTVSYNQRVRQDTVRTAMLDWIDQPPPLWKDVVQQHFTENANKILHTYNEWSKQKIPAGPYSRHVDWDDDEFASIPQSLGGGAASSMNGKRDLASLLPRLQTALQKYGATPIMLSTPQQTENQQPRLPHITRSQSTFPAPMPQPPPYTPHPPSMGLSPYPSSGFSTQHPHLLNMNLFGFGGLLGSGRVLGNRSSEQADGNAASAASDSRGGSASGGPDDGRGRHETRSSTRGRGDRRTGFTLGNLLRGDGSRGRGLGPRGGRGGFLQGRGRGEHGGRGE